MHRALAPFSITKDNILTSLNGQYTCRIDEDGKAIVRREADGSVAWESPGGGVELRLRKDGHLALCRADNSEIWTTEWDSYGGDNETELFLTQNGRLLLIFAGSLSEDEKNEPDLDFALWVSPVLPTKEEKENQIKARERRFTQDGILAMGYKMKRGRIMHARNGKFTLELADRGLVIKNSGGEPAWNSDLHAEGIPDHLAMQEDGNLVLYAADGKPLWSPNIPSTVLGGDMRCVLEDDGELVVFHSDKLMWSAGSAPGAGRLNPGAFLSKGQILRSANGQYELSLRQDGNLVLRDAAGKALWMTGLIAPEAERLVMQRDGNLVLAGANGAAIWASHTYDDVRHGKTLSVRDDGTLTVSARSGGTSWSSGAWSADRLSPGQGLLPGMGLKSPAGARLAVQEDGDIVLYCRHNHVRWSSGTKGKNIRGLCNRHDNLLTLFGRGCKALWTARQSNFSLQLQDMPHGIVLLLGTNAVVQDYRLGSGETLRPGERLLSPNSEHELTFDDEGQLVVRRTKDRRLRWVSGVKTTEGAFLRIHSNGTALVYAKDEKKVLWTLKSGGIIEGRYELTVANDGALQLHRMDPEPAIIWKIPRHRLFEGESLGFNEFLISSSEDYSFALVSGMKLELTDRRRQEKSWSSRVISKSQYESRYLFGVMKDGNLIVYDSTQQRPGDPYDGRTPLWSSRTCGDAGQYDLTLTDEGKLILCRPTDAAKPIWQVP